MHMRTSVEDILYKAEQPFNVIEEFAALSPKRKILLCDHLFAEGAHTYRQTVKLLWPEATMRDMKKLEKFLIVLKKAAH